MEGILNQVKKMLGLEAEYTAFDTDIIININSALMSLHQMGVGPTECFLIEGSSEEWSDFLGTSRDLEPVKLYLYLKTRLAFDPPSSSAAIDAIGRQISELEWRLTLQAENNLV